MKKKLMTARQAAETPLAWTFERNLAAQWGLTGSLIVTLPDQVMADQKAYNKSQMSFPVRLRDGSYRWARLNGKAYGLETGGTGDPIVSPPRWSRVRT